MHGRVFFGRLLLGLALLAPACGCGSARTEPPPSTPAEPRAGSRFEPATAGTIRGRVTWQGELPQVPLIEARLSLQPAVAPRLKVIRGNPNAPRVDPGSRGVSRAVVFLRGIDPERAKPWDLPPVRVRLQSLWLFLLQGAEETSVGIVRQGDPVEMVSEESVFHSLHAEGAAFFTLAFPDPKKPLQRRMSNKGVVELSSTAGYYWMRGYLFVDDHPYYALTDVQGRFTLTQVPPGKYEVVCWLPNWHEAGHDRDPETGVITRMFFGPPVRKSMTITVGPREVRQADFQVQGKDFIRPAH